MLTEHDKREIEKLKRFKEEMLTTTIEERFQNFLKAMRGERQEEDMEWIHDDICWCSDSYQCSNIKCFRNDKNRRVKEGLFSYASFKGTEDCPHPVWGKIQKEKENEF